MRCCTRRSSAGRIAEAISVYERLLTLARPAEQLVQLRAAAQGPRYESASRISRRDRGVSQPEEVHQPRCHLRGLSGAAAAAEAELTAALALNPRYVPALLNLATLDEDLGRREQARARYEHVLEVDPLCRLALARLAELASAAEPADPLIAQLRAAIARADTSPAELASLGFALGRLLDACGACEDAFEVYREANCQSRASAGPDRALYDRQAHERFVDELIGAFPAARRDPPGTESGVRPIFICGMYRPGSTLTEQLLAAPAGGPGEIDHRPRWRNRARPYLLDEEAVAVRLRDGNWYLRSLASLFPAPSTSPTVADNFPHIGLIKMLFRMRASCTHPQPARQLLVGVLPTRPRHELRLDLLDIAHYYASTAA
jgi:tetratricopeptide (TPR) repeat protein